MSSLFVSLVDALEYIQATTPGFVVASDPVMNDLTITINDERSWVLPLPAPDGESLDAWTQRLVNAFWEAQAMTEVDGAVDNPPD